MFVGHVVSVMLKIADFSFSIKGATVVVAKLFSFHESSNILLFLPRVSSSFVS